MASSNPNAAVIPFPGKRAPLDDLDVGALFDAHAPYLCRVVQRLTGSAEAAEDVVQEVFVLAWRRRHELEDRNGIRTWLYRVAVNHVRHGRRSYARYQNVLDRFTKRPDTDPLELPPDEAALRRQRGERIAACVAKLSDKQREVFVLYELEEIEGNEIAEILDIPINTVWSRLRLARAAFREIWSEGADHGETT
jgi:RNA polymerase sigma-70 factor (ECF subfamily)